jgi:hypothetical protein
MRIEAVRQAIQSLPITPRVLANLRETARLFSTHYSTMIEGNRLTQEQVSKVIGQEQHFPCAIGMVSFHLPKQSVGKRFAPRVMSARTGLRRSSRVAVAQPGTSTCVEPDRTR